MDIRTATNRFCKEYGLNELKLMNSNKINSKITYNSLLYLDLISYNQSCTVSYIANSLNIARSSVTIKINELEKLGLVVKNQSEHDKRVYYLSVSDLVANIFEKDNNSLMNAAKEIETKFSQHEIEVYFEMLDIFLKHFKNENCNIEINDEKANNNDN